ncbi:hypothetical protein [Aeromonas caviae]|uniref:hypothetical protein n=1 Tax=Aeromonas caviae TaxID=648 RepID=UPI00244296A2|nr:hypothetical protein [Aeromonas caviae]
MFVIWSHEKGFIMSHQLTFADSEFSSKRRQTRKEIFLSRMEQQGEIVNILLKIKNSFLPTKQILIGL